MASLSRTSRCRFGIIAVCVTSFIVVTCLGIQTADAARMKRDSNNRVLLDMLITLLKNEEADAPSRNSKRNEIFSGSKTHVRRARQVVNPNFDEAPNCGTTVFSPNVNSNAPNLISGGVGAVPNSWPWQCSLQFYNGSAYVHKCGCSVISNNNVVITAAHCVVSNNVPNLPLSFQVVCGIQNLSQSYSSPGVQVAGVSQIFVHDNFNTTANARDNDIAVVVLSTPLVFTQTVSPICLSSYNPSTADTMCYVTGWGLTHENGYIDNVLQQVNMPVFDQSTCNQTYRYGLTNNTLCAYKPGSNDSCQGDSGSPFVCLRGGKWYLQGVVSLGYGCSWPGSPGIYTRLYAYAQWIMNTVGGISILTGELSSSTASTTRTSSTTTLPTTTSSTTTSSTTTLPTTISSTTISSTTTLPTTTSLTTSSPRTSSTATSKFSSSTARCSSTGRTTENRRGYRKNDSSDDDSSDEDHRGHRQFRRGG